LRLPRLQAVEIIGGLLRVAGGGEDRPLVVFPISATSSSMRPGKIELGGCRPEEAEQGIGGGGGGSLVLLQFVSW
jgi:hypothetical protein